MGAALGEGGWIESHVFNTCYRLVHTDLMALACLCS